MAGSAKFRILFVDDEARFLAWSADLERAGYEVRTCSSEAEAQAVIAAELKTFALAVVDLSLDRQFPGDASGLNVAAAIGGRIPVLILTGGTQTPELDHAINSGLARTFVVKSGGSAALIKQIRAHIRHRVFVAHGKDEGLRNDVVFCLRAFGLEPVVLRETPGLGLTVVESIESCSNVSFAVILLTPDDVGGEAGKKAARPRARQNVILEWGYFVGFIGRERVAALEKSDERKPLEIPSNYTGLRRIAVDPTGDWRDKLADELTAAGIPVRRQRAVV